MKKQLLSFFALFSFAFSFAQCDEPQNLAATNITETSFVLTFSQTGSAAYHMVYAQPSGMPAPDANEPGIFVNNYPYVFTGLNCSTTYDIYMKTACDGTTFSDWAGPITITTQTCVPQSGAPTNLSLCSDTNQACFNLTSNDAMVLGTLSPSDYVISYHTSQADAETNVAPIVITSAYCIVGQMTSEEIFVRLEEISSGAYQVFSFALTVQSAVAGTVLQPLEQCDEDANGIVTFDLTAAAAQINTSNALTYYVNSVDAMAGVNPIANPSGYDIVTTMAVFNNIFVREEITGDCDVVYTLPISALVSCNAASLCGAANSLCGSLGIPFVNTVNFPNAEPGNDYECLLTQPNATWFYIPISQAGDLDFVISQVSDAGFGIDVDFICYGPFANPTTPCQGQLTASDVVGCSYSTAAVEGVHIPNSIPGQYYLLMVTNYANQPGQITITQTGGTGAIDCTGLQFTAFLDGNGNGTKDAGEVNFPLGDFHYTKNGGNMHNISSPTGIYGIYDIGGANIYDVNYTVDPAYASNYTVSPSSFTGLSIIPGSGLTEYFFPVTAVQNYADISVTLIPMGSPRPGFAYTNILQYTNHGTQPVSGTVTFTHDPALSITGVLEDGAALTSTGFTYDFTNLLPFESRQLDISLQVPPIPLVAIGDIVTNTASIAPIAGDIMPENNDFSLTQAIIGSYDPNDKSESHGGRIVAADFSSNDFLYYTIRFENSGNAAAENVRILDVLEDGLDPTSVRMISASHDYVLDRIGNQLTWRFDGIDLPFASDDPVGAKGYVTFMVKPKPGYAVGTVISNAASIFFDLNPAIVTDAFQTQFVENLGNPAFTDQRFVIYPNPAGDFVTVSLTEGNVSIANVSIYDMLGKKVADRKAGSPTETIDVSGIGSGIYLLEVTTSEGAKAIRKLSIR